MSEQALNLVHAIAAVVSAVGTVAAVIVALYLARRDGRIQLRVHSSLYEQFELGPGGGHQGSVFGVFATNVGRRPAAIGAISIRIGVVKPHESLLLFPPEGQNPPIGAIIEDSRQASFLLPKQRFEEEVTTKVAKDVYKRWDRKYIRLGVHTRDGSSFYIKLPPPLREIFFAAFRYAASAQDGAAG